MRYRFLICDVFTDQRFGGNQLAVLPEASGLSGARMQQIAREFNFSESTFVLPSATCTRQVRIFTPVAELVFAGHPNVGTAFVLAAIGELGQIDDATTVTFDEKAGRVPVRIRRQGTGFRCVLSAPEALSIGEAVDPTLIAAAASSMIPPLAAPTARWARCSAITMTRATARSVGASRKVWRWAGRAC